MNTSNLHPIIEAAILPFINNKKVKPKIKFILSKTIGAKENKEYVYLIEVISETGKRYQTYSEWNGYGSSAKEAKQQILNNISQTQAIDYILENIIINNQHQTPYFIEII